MTEVYVSIRELRGGFDVAVGYRESDDSSDAERRMAKGWAEGIRNALAEHPVEIVIGPDNGKGGAE